MSNSNYVVYRHVCKLNGKVYIGITQQDVSRRWRTNGYGYSNNQEFYEDILKYGWDNFYHEILYENLTKEQAEHYEKELILKYNSYDSNYGYNRRFGGGSKGLLTMETRTKISYNRRGKCTGYRDPSIGKKISEAKMGHTVSKECREKISNTLRGRFKGSNNPTSKPIRCIETGEIFECSRDACFKYNINPANMSAHLHGRKKSVNKLHFEFVFTNND